MAVPAVLLDWGTEWIKSLHPTDPIIVLGLRFAKYLIFALDSILLVIFLLRRFKRTIRQL